MNCIELEVESLVSGDEKQSEETAAVKPCKIRSYDPVMICSVSAELSAVDDADALALALALAVDLTALEG